MACAFHQFDLVAQFGRRFMQAAHRAVDCSTVDYRAGLDLAAVLGR